MKKYLILLFAFLIAAPALAQNDSVVVLNADQVKVDRSKKISEKRKAAIRKKTRILTRDLIEKGRLQFEPEFAYYRGRQMNLNAGHYSKTFSNSLNEYGVVEGWHEDTQGGKYSGKPVLQMFNGRFYCNLEPMVLRDRPEFIGIRAREFCSTIKPHGFAVDGSRDTEDYIYNDSEESLANWSSFNTEYYKVVNIEEKGEYLLGFDIVVNQYNIIENTSYEQFTFQCVINILDGRMTLRIIAGKNRVCSTYFGYMNIIRGNSF